MIPSQSLDLTGLALLLITVWAFALSFFNLRAGALEAITALRNYCAIQGNHQHQIELQIMWYRFNNSPRTPELFQSIKAEAWEVMRGLFPGSKMYYEFLALAIIANDMEGALS